MTSWPPKSVSSVLASRSEWIVGSVESFECIMSRNDTASSAPGSDIYHTTIYSLPSSSASAIEGQPVTHALSVILVLRPLPTS